MNSARAINREKLGHAGSEVISAMAYFNLFNHPLTYEEIFELSRLPDSVSAELPEVLNDLVQKGMIFKLGDYYSLQNKPEWVERRLAGRKMAEKFRKQAQLISRFIGSFPFVRGVMISGSLSKNYMDKGSDIDYFIVTESKRLWICRSILAAMRKLMVGPMRRYFCINYFVSTSSLRIPDENLFTATELVFLYPTYNGDIYRQMIQANHWVKSYYPNKLPGYYFSVKDRVSSFGIKRLLEWILSGNLGEKLDTWLFRLMLKRGLRHHGNRFSEDEFDLNLRTRREVSKQHIKGYQSIILSKYKAQLAEFENRFKVVLTHG